MTLEITVKDEITKEKNVELYNILMDKLKNTKYNVFKTPSEIVKKGKEVFETLNVEERSIVLFKMLGLFNCTLPSGIDLKLIGGSQSSAILSISMDLNKKSFSSIKIIDQSPTGLLRKSPLIYLTYELAHSSNIKKMQAGFKNGIYGCPLRGN